MVTSLSIDDAVMSRYFSATQKRALLRRAQFRCPICGTQISWHTCHADHIYPHSLGGLTRLSNGQALCISCNLKKGTTMKQLLDWQRLAFKRYKDLYLKQDIFVSVAGTGTGKTALAASILSYAYMEESCHSPIIIYVTPWRATKRSAIRWLEGHGLSCTGNNNYASDPNLDAIVCTYASAKSMLANAVEMGRKVILCLDEFHHLEENNTWATPYSNMKVGPGNLVIKALLFSGTPWHESGEIISSLVTYTEERELVRGVERVAQRVNHDSIYPYGAAVNETDDLQRNVVPLLVDLVEGTATQDVINIETGVTKVGGRILTTDCKDRGMSLDPFVDFTENSLPLYEVATTVIEKAVGFLDKYRRSPGTEYVGGLMIARRKEQAVAIQKYLMSAYGKHSIVVTSDDPKAHEAISSFEKDHSKEWIIAVDLISEGVDIPRLKVLADLTNKKTILHIIQRWGRVLRRVRKPDNTFAVDCTAIVVAVAHPMLCYVAKLMEDEIARYKKEDGEGDKPEPKSAYITTAQKTSGSQIISSGKTATYDEAELAMWLWGVNWRGIRDGRRGHTDCLFVARQMIAGDIVVPDNYEPPEEQKPREDDRTEDELKAAAIVEMTGAVNKLAYHRFNNDFRAANNFINDLMGVKCFDSSGHPRPAIDERCRLAVLHRNKVV